MFGYVVINKPDIRFKDFDRYRAYYCGLCRELKKGYGLKGQLTLNYDLTFLTILLSGLYEPVNYLSDCKCIAHPLRKHPTIQNEFSTYAADMNILLTYYKYLDDWEDDKSLGKKMLSDVLKKSGMIVAEKYPEKAEVIDTELKNLHRFEKEGSTDIDAVAGCFGRIMSAVCVYRHDEWSAYLDKLGFYLGKYIYILDAYVDYEKDIKEGAYNALGERAADKEYVRELLTMMMAECSKAFDMLPIINDFDILENIIYSGVWTGFYTGRPLDKNDIMAIN